MSHGWLGIRHTSAQGWQELRGPKPLWAQCCGEARQVIGSEGPPVNVHSPKARICREMPKYPWWRFHVLETTSCNLWGLLCTGTVPHKTKHTHRHMNGVASSRGPSPKGLFLECLSMAIAFLVCTKTHTKHIVDLQVPWTPNPQKAGTNHNAPYQWLA